MNSEERSNEERYPRGSIGSLFPEAAAMVEGLLAERNSLESRLAAALARIAAVEAEALQAIKNVPRRSGTAEWSKGSAVAQAAGFDVGLATASDAVASAFARASLAASPTPTGPEPEQDIDDDAMRAAIGLGPATPEPTEETPTDA